MGVYVDCDPVDDSKRLWILGVHAYLSWWDPSGISLPYVQSYGALILGEVDSSHVYTSSPCFRRLGTASLYRADTLRAGKLVSVKTALNPVNPWSSHNEDWACKTVTLM